MSSRSKQSLLPALAQKNEIRISSSFTRLVVISHCPRGSVKPHCAMWRISYTFFIPTPETGRGISS